MLAGVAVGQDYHFSGFLQNMVYVNPAYAAMPVTGEVGLTYRNQWPGIPATFVTYGASMVVPVKRLSSGIGVHFINDMQGSGVINQTSASLVYGYLFNLSNSWQIGAGISASYVFKTFNANELIFRSDILNDLGYGYAPVTLDSYNRNYPDFSVGIIARSSSNLSFGVSAGHVTRPQNTYSEIAGTRLPIKYTLFVSSLLPIQSQRSLVAEPALFYSRQQDNHELIWGSQFVLGGTFMAGGWIRQNLQFNMESVIAAAGIFFGKYNITYHYDVNLKKLNFLSTKMAAHEVTFLYRFEYKEEQAGKRGPGGASGRKGNGSRKVPCPAYN